MLNFSTKLFGKLFLMLTFASSIGSVHCLNAEHPDETPEMEPAVKIEPPLRLFSQHMILDWPGEKAAEEQKKGLVFRVDFDDREYLVGEPVWIRCLLINQSSEPLTISYGRNEWKGEIRFDIRDAQEKSLEGIVVGGDTMGPEAITIPAHHCLIEMFNLLDEYGVYESGNYTFSASYHSDGIAARFGPTGKYLGKVQLEKFELDQELKNLRVVDPTQEIDQAAVKLLATNPRDRYRPKSNTRFQYSFFENAKCQALIEKHQDSHFANYARYYDAKYELSRFEATTAIQFAKKALTQLEAIDTSDYPKLFQEHVHFRLIEANLAAGSDKIQTAKVVKSFRELFPNSPLLSLLKKAE